MEELVLKAKKGDKEAFMETINGSTKQLYKMGKTMGLQDEEIGDAMQDTILIAYRKIDTLNEAKFFTTWLVRIFINKCKAMLKEKNKVILLDDLTPIEKGEEESNENLELEEAISKLKDDYKIVINLYYVGGYSIKEISSILDEREGTVKSKLSRARNDLRRFYKANREVI